MRFWISTLSDLIWMVIPRPRLTIPVIAGLAFVVLVIAYTTLPQRAGALVALPLFIALVVTPMAARPLVNRLVRPLFAALCYDYQLEKGSLLPADVF